MNRALADLIRISVTTGKDLALVQGGGGNTSVKTDDGKYMYIKASGTALKDMNAHRGWRRMQLDAILSIISDERLAKREAATREPEVVDRLLLACDDKVKIEARPSVEAHLHAMLDRCVIHLHAIVVGAYVNARDGKKHIEHVFAAERWPPLWVPYTDPGFMLARKLSSLVESYQKRYRRKPSIVILEKHGVIISTGTADSALRLVRRTIRLCRQALPKLKSASTKLDANKDVTDAMLEIRKGVFDATGEYLPVEYVRPDRTIAAFMARRDAARLLATTSLTPDELVYANGPALWLDKPDAMIVTRRLRSLLSKGKRSSSAFLVKNLGLFVAADKKTTPTVIEVTTASLFVRPHAARLGGIRSLTKREEQFINNWESEAFRKKLSSSQSEGALNNRIALVTGAGSGLGRSIAIGLAQAGAMVGLLDIDAQASEDTAGVIASQYPTAHTMVLPCDVTDEGRVRQGLDRLLHNWGGLDVLVNAAGLAPAYPLVDTPVEKWRQALEVNLTGYFLMAREAAKIMVRQGMGGSIINLSSKSGLEASKDNTAYNATKAGEIHMARGWALELGQYGIRVNCVAPGNVFEGSRIWNPEYIKACAKKYGIKPEQVIPFYTSRTALNREIKGADVADAIVFLCSDRARTITGQTLVADAGQVMVR